MGKGKNKGAKRITKKQMVERVMGLFEGHPTQRYELKEVFRLLGLDTHPAKMT